MNNSVNHKLELSESGLKFISRFEGFSADWYTCPAGKPTIGYGHVRRNGEAFPTPITEKFALALMRIDAQHAANTVLENVKVPLAQHEFDALVSFVFNVGAGAFRRSTLLKFLNEGSALGRSGAANQFEIWIYAGKKPLEGLKIRREAEKKLFLTGDYE